MSERSAPTLVLDLDGTLVDTARDLVQALNAVLAQEGVEPIPLAEAVTMVGHGARAMLRAGLIACGREPCAGQLDGLVARFLAYYSDHIADHSRPYPGVPDALDRFASAGWRMAVCTNKFEAAARLLLAKLGLADRFAAISGQDTFGVMKPDPRHLLETIRVAGGRPEFAVMVGDSGVDADTARGAGIPVVLVKFGYSQVPVATLGADRLIDNYGELFDAAGGLVKIT